MQAVTREMREETGLTVHAPRLCGIKQFQTDADERYIVLLFKTDRFSGTLRSSEEGEMVWVERDALDAYPLVEDFRELLSVFDRDDLTEFQYERAPARPQTARTPVLNAGCQPLSGSLRRTIWMWSSHTPLMRR